MSLQTRGSAELDKAQRRLAGLKSIDPNLDLGFGLSVQAYSEFIEAHREAIAKHNQMVADITASRKTLDEFDRKSASLSSRILGAVKITYGSNSTEYTQVGGNIRKGSTASSPSSDAEIEIDARNTLRSQASITN